MIYIPWSAAEARAIGKNDQRRVARDSSAYCYDFWRAWTIARELSEHRARLRRVGMRRADRDVLIAAIATAASVPGRRP